MATQYLLALLSLPLMASGFQLSVSGALRQASAASKSVRAHGIATSKRQNLGLRMQFAAKDPSAGLTCYAGVAELEDNDYLAFGLAQCYKVDEGQVSEEWLIEPLTGATLECLHKGLPTSYRRTLAVRAGDFFAGGANKPTGINAQILQPLMANGEQASLCDAIMERTLAAGRTLRRRVESQVVPVGQVYDKYNFQPSANKRIVNMKHEVNDDDNVKQDMSIDVYGRKKGSCHLPE